jgi:hypothetical protein
MNHKLSAIVSIIPFAVINLIMLSILTYWGIRFLDSYSLYYQSATQVFLFFLTHLTTLWVILQISWLFYWSSKLFKHTKHTLLSYLTLLYSLFVTASVSWGIYRHYYQIGQQSSWMRFFNQHEQIMTASIWLFSYIAPVMLFLLLLVFFGRLDARKHRQTNLKRWTVLLILCLALLLTWGMSLSWRDSYLLTQDQAMSGIYRDYSLIAIYNPLSAIVALGKTLFTSAAGLAETTSLMHVRFNIHGMAGAGWPNFFPGFFYVKMIAMALVSSLGIFLSLLIKKQLD